MTVTLTVTGMSCGGCESNVVDALEGVSGVDSASADRDSDTATVEGEVDTGALVAAVSDAGYEASV